MRISQDLHYAWRQISKSPGFALIVLLTLGLTVALSTTVFSVLDAVFVRPLPYAHPEKIFSLTTYSPQGYTQPASYLEYLDWKLDAKAFSALAIYNAWTSVNAETASRAVSLHSVSTSDNFFDVFGVKPFLGRTFARGEEQPGRNLVAVLSNEVWRTSFSARMDAVGSKIKLDGRLYTIVGVMPAGFRFPINRTDAIYIPLNLSAAQLSNRGDHDFPTIARLAPGVSAQAAQEDFNRILRQLGRVYPDTAGRKAKLVDLNTFISGDYRSALRLLFVATVAILLIGCVNLSGMLLARGVRQGREMAVRAALGAGRRTIIRQLLTENLLYAIAGGALGVTIAYGLLHVISVLLIASLARGSEISLNGTVLLESLSVSIATSLLAGLIPAVRLSGTSAGMALRSGVRAGADRHQSRLRASFVVIQVALALSLLFTAGLVFRSLAALRQTNFGFDPSHILTAELDLSPGNYQNRDVITDFYSPLLERVKTLPGVRSAGLIQIVPIQRSGMNESVQIGGQPPAAPNEERLAEIRFVTPGYYSVFGVQLIRGRLPDERIDLPGTSRVTVVNERFVQRFIPPGQDPIGMFVLDGDAKVRIIGVVRNIRQWIYGPSLAEMDWPISQIPHNLRLSLLAGMQLVVNTAGRPEGISLSLRKIVHELDRTIPFHSPETMDEIVAGVLTLQRLETWLFVNFAALAFALALLGLYGLVSHEVEMSSRDIGVRIALGAPRARIFSLVYSRLSLLLGLGIALGLFATGAAHAIIETVVPFELQHDLIVFVSVVVLFIAVASLAAFIPARTAANLNPIDSLRFE